MQDEMEQDVQCESARLNEVRESSYILYRCRLEASKRLKRAAWRWNVALAASALFLVVLSLIQLAYPERLGRETSVASTALSVLILVLSLIVTQCDFGARAQAMFSNYRRFQGLYDDVKILQSRGFDESELAALEKRRHDLLDESENHEFVDYLRFRYAESWRAEEDAPGLEKLAGPHWRIKLWLAALRGAAPYLVTASETIAVLFVAWQNYHG